MIHRRASDLLKYWIGIILIILLLISTWGMFKITLPYTSFSYEIDFLLTKQYILHKSIWRWSFYIHIFSSIFVLFFGIFQFIKPILTNYPNIHSALGKAYVIIILLCSAPSGLIMGFYANGGFWAKTSFVIISILWWIFTLQGYLTIRKKNRKAHINYMVRSYALTLSAISLRTYVLFLPSLIHLPAKEMYTLVAWGSWIPNLIIAELLIKYRVFK